MGGNPSRESLARVRILPHDTCMRKARERNIYVRTPAYISRLIIAVEKRDKRRNFINDRSLRARNLRLSALTSRTSYILDKSMSTTWKIDFGRPRCSCGPVNANIIIDNCRVIHSGSRNRDNGSRQCRTCKYLTNFGTVCVWFRRYRIYLR